MHDCDLTMLFPSRLGVTLTIMSFHVSCYTTFSFDNDLCKLQNVTLSNSNSSALMPRHAMCRCCLN